MNHKKDKNFGELVKLRLAKYESLTRPCPHSYPIPPCHVYKRSWSYDEKELISRKMHITSNKIIRHEPVDNVKRDKEPEYVRHLITIIIRLWLYPISEHVLFLKNMQDVFCVAYDLQQHLEIILCIYCQSHSRTLCIMSVTS